MAEVALQQVTKRFGEASAVESLSLTVADGEFVVLLGPTGAGKTTTLRLIAGLERADSGRISIAGQDVTSAAPAERDVAFVFQQFSLYPHYTVYENLAFPLRSPRYRMSDDEIKRKVTEVAELLRIGSKLENRATKLSGGEMQRVAIGRALVREPNIFLMDEPLSSLDAKLREDLRVELKRIQMDLGATILYVTHDQVEALTMADRIGVLDHGRLVQVGAPRAVYEMPATTYIAQRLGSPQINLLPVGAPGTEGAPPGTATVGIRPEGLRVGEGSLSAVVRNVEHLGAETILVVEVAGHQLHAFAAHGSTLQPGEETVMRFVEDGALWFDAEGRRIDPAGSAPVQQSGAAE
jgi:multiple sugar transport system ATP-binding protein